MGKRRIAEEEGLNLVPIMNLVTILIPFLLMSVQFASLAVIDTTLPAISEAVPTDEEPEEDKKLKLKVIISEAGFTVDGAETILTEEEGENGRVIPCTTDGCPSADSYDVRGLAERLSKVKDEIEDTERDTPDVILVPGSSVPYEVIVYAMDATRDDNYAREKDAKGPARDLFPNVVLAGGVD